MRHWIVRFVAVCIVVVVTYSANAQTKITLGYTSSTSWTGAFIAKDQAFFSKHNIDADLTFIAVNPSIPPSLIAGSLQVGGIATPEVLRAVDSGMELVIVAGALQALGKAATGPSGGGVIGQNGLEIKEPQDFVGKKVGVPGIGSAMDIGFRKWLFDNGVNLKSVTFVEVPFPQGGDVLKAKLVDAVVSNSPFFGRILDSHAGYLIRDHLRELGGGVSTMYVATREWVSQHQDAVREFREALIEANAFLKENPDAAKASVAKWTKLPPEAQANIVLPTLKPVVVATDLTIWSNAMVEQGLLKTSPDLSNVIAP